jgi:hypothetical protein
LPRPPFPLSISGGDALAVDVSGLNPSVRVPDGQLRLVLHVRGTVRQHDEPQLSAEAGPGGLLVGLGGGHLSLPGSLAPWNVDHGFQLVGFGQRRIWKGPKGGSDEAAIRIRTADPVPPFRHRHAAARLDNAPSGRGRVVP